MIIWLILIIAAYLIGSVPVSYLAARARGIDLRRQGTSQVGVGNLWRTTSRKLGMAAAIFDFLKGLGMVWIAQSLGLDVSQQIIVGAAAIAGHNWPVFLRFHGGRGVATSLGIIIILPCINQQMTPWASAVFFIILFGGILTARKTHVPILIGIIALPVVSAIAGEPVSVTLAFLTMPLLMILKRLTAQPGNGDFKINRRQLLLNRLLFDRDIRDKKAWVSRKPAPEPKPEAPDDSPNQDTGGQHE